MPTGVILCTASYDHTIRFWEATSGMCHQTIQFTDSQVNSLQITNDKGMVAAACHHIIRLFSLTDAPSYSRHQNANQQTIPQIGTLEGHTANVLTLGFPVDDQWMYSGGEDGCIKLWDLGSMSCQRTYKVKSHVNSLCLHPNQAELVSGEENGCLRVWDLTSDQCVCLVNPMIDSIVASQPGSNTQEQPANQQQQQQQDVQTQKPNEKKDDIQNHVANGGGEWTKNNLLAYSAQTGHFLKCGISSVSMSNNGRFVCAANQRGQVFVYKIVKVETQLPKHGANYDSDDQEDDEEEMGSYRVSKLQFVTHFQAHNTYILKIQISPDCLQLATCSADSTVKLWDLTNISPGVPINLIKSLNAHKKWVWDCCYSSDSAYLVTCSSDMTAKLWDVARGECIKEYKGHQKAVVAIALNDMSFV